MAEASGALVLRRATAGDAPFVLECRNDPDAVRHSMTGTPVAAGDHESWFAHRLEHPESPLWVGEVDGVRVGNVRLDVDGPVGEVGIAVHPSARGAGHGRALLAAMLAEAARAGRVREVVARVHRDNAASLRLFRGAGFGVEEQEGRFVLLRRPIEVPIEKA
jgi:ribosomal protein S18 acetylase RimI-like enzyme